MVSPWRTVVLGVGLVTMIAGGLRAWRQYDLKLLLAYGTVSQLGFLFVLFGTGVAGATLAGALLIVAHGFFKAALFMVVGIVEHETGTRDFRRIDRLPSSWNPIRVVTIAAAASMAGIPLTLGFLAKESAYDAFAHGQIGSAALVLTALVVGSSITIAYTVRFVVGGFFSPARDTHQHNAVTPEHGVRGAFLAPAAVLAAAGVVFGIVPALIDPFVDAAVRALVPGSDPPAVVLWHGVSLALVLSIVTYALGALLAWARDALSSALSRGSRDHVGGVGLPRSAARREPRRRPRHRRRPERLPAGVPRGDPRHCRGRARDRARVGRRLADIARPGAGSRAAPDRCGRDRIRRGRRRGAAPLRGRAVCRGHRLRDGGALRAAGRS